MKLQRQTSADEEEREKIKSYTTAITRMIFTWTYLKGGLMVLASLAREPGLTVRWVLDGGDAGQLTFLFDFLSQYS